MLYYLFEFIEQKFQFPGATLFQFISFRASLAIIISLLFSLIYGRIIIQFLKAKQIRESVRDLGLMGEKEKEGTPTMGGVIIILGTLIPVFLLAKLENIYIILLIISTVSMGAIGLVDDYIKIFKRHKDGLKGKFKLFGQIFLGAIIGSVLYFHPEVTVREEIRTFESNRNTIIQEVFNHEKKSTLTTIPLIKDNAFDYSDLVTWISPAMKRYTWAVFIPIVIFILTAVSNGANLTDGIDGLAAGSSAIIVLALGLFAWVSGNSIFSDYLNIMYIPNVGEVVIFVAAFSGSLIGFLWFNAYPATVFMGDTGSLTIGAIIAVIALIVRKELLIPLLCGVFLVENLSVILQVGYFKYSKKKTGVGRRIFKMSPLHHHFQKMGYHESKIVARFWIIGIILAVLSIVTLKIR
jgi:phospho-N-acetylmuramoyl-pentapeptide-transferase